MVGSAESRALVFSVGLALTGVLVAGCAAPAAPDAEQVSTQAARMAKDSIRGTARVNAGDPVAIRCPEITADGSIVYEVPIKVDGVLRPPMRISYRRGNWSNLNGTCVQCHRGDSADFESSNQPPKLGAF